MNLSAFTARGFQAKVRLFLRLPFTVGPFVCVVCLKGERAAKWDNRTPQSEEDVLIVKEELCTVYAGWILGSLSGNEYL